MGEEPEGVEGEGEIEGFEGGGKVSGNIGELWVKAGKENEAAVVGADAGAGDGKEKGA